MFPFWSFSLNRPQPSSIIVSLIRPLDLPRIFYWIGPQASSIIFSLTRPLIWNVDLSDLTSSLIHLECLDYSFFWINICILNLDDLGDLTSSIWILKATASACQALFLNVDIYKYIWMGESAPVSKLRSGDRGSGVVWWGGLVWGELLESWIGLLRTSSHKMFFL